MSTIMQDLHTIGLNPFAVTLVAESLLKSPLAPMTVGKAQGFFFPVSRSDCAGWAGVRMTLEAVPADETDAERTAPRPTAGAMAVAAPQPAQADMAPEYAAAVRELAEQLGMSEAQVLRAAIRLYQAERKGLVTVEHKEQIGPLAAPRPEAQPRWIPVEERLPPINTEVLVAFDAISIAATGQYTGSPHDLDRGGWCYPAENRGTCNDFSDPVVTHWMPLPAAPSAQAEPVKCKTCGGAGGWEAEFSSTRGGWVKCQDCKAQAEQGGK